jgi:hypothetical protein
MEYVLPEKVNNWCVSVNVFPLYWYTLDTACVKWALRSLSISPEVGHPPPTLFVYDLRVVGDKHQVLIYKYRATGINIRGERERERERERESSTNVRLLPGVLSMKYLFVEA